MKECLNQKVEENKPASIQYIQLGTILWFLMVQYLQACFKHDMVVGQDENIVEKSHHVITVKLKKVRAAEVVLLADMT